MRRWLWIAAATVAVDRITKLLARRLTGPVALVPGVVGLRHVENTGAAFGMLAGHPWALGLLSLALIALGWLLLRHTRLTALGRAGAMLALGGAVSNAFDRLFLGSVTDMVEPLMVRFAVFNAADAALVIGLSLLALSLLREPPEEEGRGEGPEK